MADSRFIRSERARGRRLRASSSWRRANEARSESHQAVLGGRHQGKALGSWGLWKILPCFSSIKPGPGFLSETHPSNALLPRPTHLLPIRHEDMISCTLLWAAMVKWWHQGCCLLWWGPTGWSEGKEMIEGNCSEQEAAGQAEPEPHSA